MKKTRKGEFVSHEISIPIRFSEVDSMGIVWHGNYLKYFEDAREALGQQIGMGYMDVYDKGFMIPLVHSEIDYKSPIKYKDEIIVKVWLKNEVAAKIVNDFEIFNRTTGKLVCTGNAIQAFIDLEGDLQLVLPEFYENWKKTLNWTQY